MLRVIDGSHAALAKFVQDRLAPQNQRLLLPSIDRLRLKRCQLLEARQLLSRLLSSLNFHACCESC